MKRLKALSGWIRAFMILLALQPKWAAIEAHRASCGECLGAGYQYWAAGDQYEVKACENCGQNSQNKSATNT